MMLVYDILYALLSVQRTILSPLYQHHSFIDMNLLCPEPYPLYLLRHDICFC
jgi:hypothetical protein